jgi:hypothetical protein
VKRFERRNTNSIGTVHNMQLSPAFIHEAGQTRHSYKRSGRICNKSRKNWQNFFFRQASPGSRVKVAAPILIAQHEGNKRIGKAWIQFRPVSPTGPKIAN